MRHCAFLSIDDLSGYVSDDQPAVEAFRRRGWEAEIVPWTSDADWTCYEAVVIRSTWNYHHHVEQFLSVLEHIEAQTYLLNPLEIVRWNARKSYLLDLLERGVPIVPTAFGRGLRLGDIDEYRERFGAAGIVVKPVIGAGADRTHLLRHDAPAGKAETAVRDFHDAEFMAQPFVESVVVQGEYSLFYFEGEFSHAVVKTPALQDFRVQEEHGGTIRPTTPHAALHASARQAVGAVSKVPLYARADLVEGPTGEWLVMELELIEPSLYLRSSPDAADRFADAFVERIARRERAELAE